MLKLSNDSTFHAGLAQMRQGICQMVGGGVTLATTTGPMAIGMAGIGAAVVKGGGYGVVRAANRNGGGEVHHMPSKDAMKRAGGPFSMKKGPGILMDAADHHKTARWGTAGKLYRDWQVQMLKQGRFLDVLARDIRNVEGVAPGRYSDQIQQMVDYLWSGDW